MYELCEAPAGSISENYIDPISYLLLT
jgi:hypothetical protein